MSDRPSSPAKTDIVVSLITPMYNESEGIQDSIRSILGALKNLGTTWEYILVNDGSTDDSLAKASEVFADNPHCRIVHYDINRGRGYALRQGFSEARGQYVITTESDLSWGAEIIGQLYDTIRDKAADMAIASVFLPGGGMENVPAFRRHISFLGNKIMRWAFGGGLTMYSGMTRAYTRKTVDSLYLEEDNKEIHLEIILKAQALGLRMKEIPAVIQWSAPRFDSKHRDVGSTLRFVLPHLLLSFHRASVRLLTTLATVIGGLGILVVFIGIIHKFFPIFPLQMGNLVLYGAFLCLTSIFFALFNLVSVQLSFLHRSTIHIQSQLKQLTRDLEEGRKENAPRIK